MSVGRLDVGMDREFQYEVSLANIFDAVSPEDAVIQMAEWAKEYAYEAGYRVSWTDSDGYHYEFYDAEDIDPMTVYPDIYGENKNGK